MRERCIVAHAERFHDKSAARNQGGAGERIAGLLFNGNALARHGGFVNRTRTFCYDAVDRNGCAGFQHDQVARSNRLAGDGHFLAVAKHHGCFGGKGSKFFNRIRRAALGACFKPFAYGDERDDHGCAFKIKAVGKMKRMIDLTGSGPIGRFSKHPDAIYEGGACAYCNERVH